MKVAIDNIQANDRLESLIARRERQGFKYTGRDAEFIYFDEMPSTNRRIYSVTNKATGECYDYFTKREAVSTAKELGIRYIDVSNEEGDEYNYIEL